MKPWQKRLLWISAPTILTLGYLAYKNPLLLRDFSHVIDMLKIGARPYSHTLTKGYRMGSCDPSQSQTRCRCIALLHGLGDQALGWRKLFQEIALKPEESQNLWLAINLPENKSTVSEIALEVRSILESSCPQWIVIGNSLGGWVATHLALQWRDGVSRLVLIDSAGLKSTQSATDASYFKNPSVETLKAFLTKAYAHPRNDLSDSVLKLAVDRMKESSAMKLKLPQPDDQYLDSKLTSLRMKTLILWGEKDGIIPITTARKLNQLIPGSELQELLDCGHLPQKECPKLTLGVILDWLERNP